MNSIYDICSPVFDRKLLQLPSKELHNENTIDSLEIDRNTTATGPRNFSTSNRVSRIANTTQNNFINKRKQDSVELKLDLDNLPVVDLNNPKKKKLQIHTVHKPTISPNINSNATANP